VAEDLKTRPRCSDRVLAHCKILLVLPTAWKTIM